jgi:hypothetical protein
VKRVVVALALSAAACAVPAGPDEQIGRVSSAIVNGADSDATQDSVVLLVRYDPSLPGGAASDCSGTLLSPRIVLTARHCVSNTDPNAACNQEGKSDGGGQVLGEFPPKSVFAFKGVTRPDILAGAKGIRGAEILTNGAPNICDNDIALVVLESAVPDAPIAPVRLTGTATKSEKTTIVGWGVTERGPQPTTRQQRTDVEVEDVGPAPQLGPREVLVGEGSCSGDSGGPLFSRDTGAVIGVLSRGGNGIDRVVPAACLGAVNVYSSSGAHAELIRAAFAKTGEAVWVEGERDPRLPPEDEDDEGLCSVSAPGASRRACGVGLLVAAAVALQRRRRRDGQRSSAG